MLNNEELQKIKKKIKETRTYGSTLAKRFGVSRQAINLVLHQKCESKNLENKLINWLNE